MSRGWPLPPWGTLDMPQPVSSLPWVCPSGQRRQSPAGWWEDVRVTARKGPASSSTPAAPGAGSLWEWVEGGWPTGVGQEGGILEGRCQFSGVMGGRALGSRAGVQATAPTQDPETQSALTWESMPVSLTPGLLAAPTDPTGVGGRWDILTPGSWEGSECGLEGCPKAGGSSVTDSVWVYCPCKA